MKKNGVLILNKISEQYAIFDYDGTLTTNDTFSELLKYVYGTCNFYIVQFFLMPFAGLMHIGLFSNRNFKNLQLNLLGKFRFISGETLTEVSTRWAEKNVFRFLNFGAVERLLEHQRVGIQVVIISATPSILINEFAKLFNVTHVLAGKLTSRKNKPLIVSAPFGRGKVKILRETFDLKNSEFLYGYGDSPQDRYFLKITREMAKRRIPLVESVVMLNGDSRKAHDVVTDINRTTDNIVVQSPSYFSAIRLSRNTRSFLQRELDGEFLNWLLSQQSSTRPVIVPLEESGVKFLLKNQLALRKKYDFLIPKERAFDTANDKFETWRVAKSLQIPVPATVEIDLNHDKWAEFILRPGSVIKPRCGQGSSGIRYTDSLPSNFSLSDHQSEYGPLLLQDRIPENGRIVGTSFLYDSDGQCLLEFCHQRDKQYPTTGGPGTRCSSVQNQQLLDRSKMLMEEIGWSGPVMVEWKYDSRIDDYVLLEINPRFWGSIGLAISCGASFPSAYVLACKGKYDPRFFSVINHGKWSWLFPGEILRYVAECRTGANESLDEFLRDSVLPAINKIPDDPVYGLLSPAYILVDSLLDKNKRKKIFAVR